MDMTAKEFRLDIGIEILEVMKKNDDLPLPNIHRVSKTMQEYYIQLGYEDYVKESGYKWQASTDYWIHAMTDIQLFLMEDKKFFAFVRNNGLHGYWDFLSKKEYTKRIERGTQEILTRTDNINTGIVESQKKWKHGKPVIDAKLKQLTK